MENDNRSRALREHALLPRLASASLEAALGAMPVVLLMGARQTGKSTLVRNHSRLRSRPYLTLDDFDVYADARTNPDDVVASAPDLTIDEVQREAGLLRAIKRAVDEGGGRWPGRFVLTGSVNLLLMEKISESLAGRAAYVPLWPFTRGELRGEARAGLWRTLLEAPFEEWEEIVRLRAATPEDWREAARVGGYPTPAYEMQEDELRRTWFRGYVQTYLERDLQSLAAIDNLVDFRRLMRAMALRIGGVVNRAEIGRDTGISRPTVHRYMGLLETSCQLVRVEAYSVNRTKRLIKSPKMYWGDTGLAMHVAGEDEPRGEHLENLVLSDLVAWRDAEPGAPQVLYWRTTEGEEVDFVIEDGARLLPIEVKASTRPRRRDTAALRTFIGQYDAETAGGLLLHAGEDVFPIARRILAVPWWRVM
jgi:predicted AAA+ superfamily ATPase